MNNIAIEVNDLLEKLTQELYLPELDPLLDVTATMLASKTGRNRNKMLEFLQAEETAGRLVAHKARGEKGQPVIAFRKA